MQKLKGVERQNVFIEDEQKKFQNRIKDINYSNDLMYKYKT